MNLQKDKVWYFGVGVVISFVINLFFTLMSWHAGWLWGFILAACAGLAKEAFDVMDPVNHSTEVEYFYYIAFGGLLASMLFELGK